MKCKSRYISILILIFILFSITAVSASENQTASMGADGLSEDSNLEEVTQIDDYNQEQLDTFNEGNNLQRDMETPDSTPVQADSDEYSFSELYKAINQSGEELNIQHDYTFNKNYDSELFDELMEYYAVDISKDKLVINGFNHVIDGAGEGAQFNFDNKNGEILINDLTFKNFNLAALSFRGKATLNNVNFTNCSELVTGVISVSYGKISVNNCRFYQNSAITFINGVYSNITVINSNFSGEDSDKAIKTNRGQLYVFNSIFENFTSKNGAIMDFKGDLLELVGSRFANSYSSTSGGAILVKYFPFNNGTSKKPSYIPSSPILIKDCIFYNLTCINDGGAIHMDLDTGSYHIPKTVNIECTNFTDCTSRFGGAISIQGGTLNINECNFINNCANFKGGAICSSWTNVSITKSSFRDNTAVKTGGAICFDKYRLIIRQSNFTGNNVLEQSSIAAGAIYAHDVEIDFTNSIFDNGGVAVYADFASDSKIENVEKNDDIFLLDNRNYILSVENKGIKFNFTGNEIIADTLPSRFDAREWGWTTPGKVQGDNDDCWAFATIASIETALGKATGTLFNLSQNYAQTLQLKYYEVGDLRNSLTGFSYSGLGYALSWYGVLPMDIPYDDRGMISDADIHVERIHVQDAMFIYTGMKDTIELIKRAVLKYGAVTVQEWATPPKDEIPTEGEDIAIMDHSTHFVSIIGWDDDYVDRFSSQKGGWITKDSLSGFGKMSYTNFPQADYYAIEPQRVAIAYIFENDIDYHVNYQTDLTGLAGFDKNYTYYSNEFTSKYDELIGAVGTYFNESGISYSFDIFVNGKLVHSQSGISEFAGFRTIVLSKYIPVKTGDRFKVVFKSNSVPYQAWSRVHYLDGTSFVSKDKSGWTDWAPLNKTVCLKVYTVVDDSKMINNKDISVDYASGSYFSVKVVTADGRAVGDGEKVTFKVNGVTYICVTDNNGYASLKINLKPGTYTITSSYRGVSKINKITVKSIVVAKNFNVKKTAKKLKIKVSLKKVNGKYLKGKTLKLKFKGKTYKAKTNKNGVATFTIKKNILKKLKKGKKYSYRVTYINDSVKKTVTVKK